MFLLPHGLYRFHSSFLHLVLLISTSILVIHHTAQTPRSLHVDGEYNKAPSPDSMRFSQKCHRHSQIGTTFASPTEPRLLSRLRPPRLSVRAQTEPLESACCTMKQDRHNRLRRAHETASSTRDLRPDTQTRIQPSLTMQRPEYARPCGMPRHLKRAECELTSAGIRDFTWAFYSYLPSPERSIERCSEPGWRVGLSSRGHTGIPAHALLEWKEGISLPEGTLQGCGCVCCFTPIHSRAISS
jgi:hypothetical protein